MRPPTQLKTKTPSRASALQVTFSISLIFAFAILLAIAAVTTPILGNYPNTSLPLSTDTTVTPDVPPTNTVSINVPPLLTSRERWQAIRPRVSSV